MLVSPPLSYRFICLAYYEYAETKSATGSSNVKRLDFWLQFDIVKSEYLRNKETLSLNHVRTTLLNLALFSFALFTLASNFLPISIDLLSDTLNFCLLFCLSLVVFIAPQPSLQ